MCRLLHSRAPKHNADFRGAYTMRSVVVNKQQLQPVISSTCGFSSQAEVYDDIDECEASSSNNSTQRSKGPHCKTCTCTFSDDSSIQILHKEHHCNSPDHAPQLQNQNLSTRESCHLQTPLFDPNTPMPPPLPNPTYSFKKRVLPSNLVAFTSKEGKQRFLRSISSNYAEAYYPLIQQFLNQSDPAYCGVTTLVLILNALAMDPNVRWRGGWRWYGDESMLLERCCLEEERVAREGISIEMFGGLARCQGVDVLLKRPLDGSDTVVVHEQKSSINRFGVDEFRKDVIDAVRMPPKMDWEDGDAKQSIDALDKHTTGGYFLVTSFSRSSLKQTGDGHFSPIAAYDPDTDSCLVLDVARFKYAPYWVAVQDLYDAMIPHDSMTEKSRGWILMYPPRTNQNRVKQTTLSVEEKEGKRLAACVPTAGSGVSICPMEDMKKEYCAANSTKPRR